MSNRGEEKGMVEIQENLDRIRNKIDKKYERLADTPASNYRKRNRILDKIDALEAEEKGLEEHLSELQNSRGGAEYES